MPSIIAELARHREAPQTIGLMRKPQLMSTAETRHTEAREFEDVPSNRRVLEVSLS